MPRKLDWETPLGKTNLGDHWRILLCVAMGIATAVPIWHAFFPHTFWFLKLWAGFATGATAGMVTGVWWQLRDEARYPKTSGTFISTASSAWGAFAAISIFWMLPDLDSQESERAQFRSISTEDISSIIVRVDGQDPIEIQDSEIIASFAAIAHRVDLFYPSHEMSVIQFQLVLIRNDGTLTKYRGRVPEHHLNDFSLDYRMSEIIFPGGRRWLDSVTRQDGSSK